MQLGSGVAVTVVCAGSCSFYSAPSLGTSVCHRAALKRYQKYIYICYSASKYLGAFKNILLISNFIPMWSENILCMISVYLNFMETFYGLSYGLSEHFMCS